MRSGLILRQEPLYQGMNGRYVERFYVSPSESYIFKPVTHEGQDKREAWVYEHILRQLPAADAGMDNMYPKMLDKSPDSGAQWAIYEDLGALRHDHDPAVLLKLGAVTARLHSMPADRWRQADLVSPKPPVAAMIKELKGRREETELFLQGVGIRSELFWDAAARMEDWVCGSETVLSHGDLHAGNFGFSRNRLYVLDWEHVHFNLPYWDLFHFMDLSHPVFPRTKLVTARQREQILSVYLDGRQRYGTEINRKAFIENYYRFALIFSVWLARLIQSDLRNGSVCWTKAQLERQRAECLNSLSDCAKRLKQQVKR